MRVIFEKEYLRDIFVSGKCSDKKHRYQPDIVRRYIKCIRRMQRARGIEELQQYGGLHYEVLKGDKDGISSVRVNDQYRVEFTVYTIDEVTLVTVCNIIELSNHYK